MPMHCSAKMDSIMKDSGRLVDTGTGVSSLLSAFPELFQLIVAS